MVSFDCTNSIYLIIICFSFIRTFILFLWNVYGLETSSMMKINVNTLFTNDHSQLILFEQKRPILIKTK